MKQTSKNKNETSLNSRLSSENEFESMIRSLTALKRELHDSWRRVETELEGLDERARGSARNLVYYLALRRHDMRALQNDLSRHGISSLGRSEPYVMTNIDKVARLLNRIVGRSAFPSSDETELSLDDGKSILKERANALFGAEPKRRNVRIMVTLPAEAADDYDLVRDLIKGGMNCARINCAHDDAAIWKRMVENIRRAEKETGNECRISIDIAGPKLRTGKLDDGPRVLKLRPARDFFGRVVRPAQIRLTSIENPVSVSADATLAFPKKFLEKLKVGDRLKFKDARGARRRLKIIESGNGAFLGECRRTAYVTPETEFKKKIHELKSRARAENIPPLEQFISLQTGDELILTKSPTPGSAAKTGENGEILEPARISCTLPEVFDCVKSGESIWFDDGKIGGKIKSVSGDEMLVEITHSGAGTQKLRADKGINLPDSRLNFPSLTAKDLADLEFIVRHADLIGYSFVRSAADVVGLQNKLKELGGDRLGVILKIETRRAFDELPDILLAALGSHVVGVMIARGDLAIETGFERLAEVQEEILWMCEAAHMPVIWATQVLETLSKTGVYSRAEITDAAMSERAECVMLNKGAFVVEAVRTLDDILTRMQAHQDKKRSMLRHLKMADRFFDRRKKSAKTSSQ